MKKETKNKVHNYWIDLFVNLDSKKGDCTSGQHYQSIAQLRCKFDEHQPLLKDVYFPVLDMNLKFWKCRCGKDITGVNATIKEEILPDLIAKLKSLDQEKYEIKIYNETVKRRSDYGQKRK